MSKYEEEKSSLDPVTLPEGRLINESLMVKDQYNAQAKPSYKAEIAFEDTDEVVGFIEDAMYEAAIAEWGEEIEDDPDFVLPLIEGDKLARKREKKGKEGDAYKGKIVLRCKTDYNHEGIDGPGGIQVYDESNERIEPAAFKSQVYPGCFGKVAVTFKAWETDDGEPRLTTYLVAFQKTADGPKLVRAADRSSLFEPVKKVEKEGGTRRSRRSARG